MPIIAEDDASQPAHYDFELVKQIHELPLETAHVGGHKLLQRLVSRYYWPTLRKDVLDYAKTCDVCQKSSLIAGEKLDGSTPYQFPRVPITLVNFPLSNGYNTVLVFTKHVLFIATHSKLNKKGSCGVSTARHPQTDGQMERINQTLEIALRAYTASRKESWSDYAYNFTLLCSS